MSLKNGKPKVPDQYNDYLMEQAFRVFTLVTIYRINISEQNWIFDFFYNLTYRLTLDSLDFVFRICGSSWIWLRYKIWPKEREKV